jgi:hypothetical protein
MIKRLFVVVSLGVLLPGSVSAQTASAQTIVAPAPAAPAAPDPAAGKILQDSSAADAPAERFWFQSDYLLAWFRTGNIPALITTSPAGTPQSQAGVATLATTSVLYGGIGVNDDFRSGFRLGTGYWFDEGRTVGIEGGFTMLASQAAGFSTSSNGTPILARPYTDAITGIPQSSLVAFPGSSTGSIDILARSGNYYDGHIDISDNLFSCDWFRLDGLLGYRVIRYDEGFHIQQTVSPTSGNFTAGTQLVGQDNFNTQNTFQGGDLGLRGRFDWGNMTLGFLTRVSIGQTFREVGINGSQVITVPGSAPLAQTGGLYALTSNIGDHRHANYSVNPEFGLDWSWRITNNFKAHLGYTALLLTRIARAPEQIDFNLNTGQFPGGPGALSGPNLPAFKLQTNEIWIQSLSAGLEFDY